MNSNADREMTLKGRMANAKYAPLMRSSDGDCYLEGLGDAERQVIGRLVEASGVVRVQHNDDAALRDAEGAVRQGLAGTVRVMQVKAWKFVD